MVNEKLVHPHGIVGVGVTLSLPTRPQWVKWKLLRDTEGVEGSCNFFLAPLAISLSILILFTWW